MTCGAERKRLPSIRGRPGRAPSLAEIQDHFQNAVLASSDVLLDFIPNSSRTTRQVLLGVYRHAYAARLVDVAGGDYPCLKSYMGPAAFDEMVRGFLEASPSRHANVRWFSSGLPEHLSSVAPHAQNGVLAELALIERALNDAFDAADAPTLTLKDLARYGPERWGDLILSPQPSAVRLDLSTNAFAVWRALKDGGDVPLAAASSSRKRIIVWRREVTPTVRTFPTEEAMMWDEAAKGARFSALCELAATFADPEGAPLRAAQYLTAWIGAGLLRGARVARARRRSALAVGRAS
jgi:hypothetical protein